MKVVRSIVFAVIFYGWSTFLSPLYVPFMLLPRRGFWFMAWMWVRSCLVIVETVGVGQSEVEIAKNADLVIVVLAPGQGDSIQMLKAGLMEAGDLFVVNKADRPDAAHLHQAFGIDWLGQVLMESDGQGFRPIWHGGIGRHGNSRNRLDCLRRVRANAADERVSILVGESNVCDDDRRPHAIERCERVAGRTKRRDRRAVLP